MAEGTPFTITNCSVVSLAKKSGIKKDNTPYLLFKFKVDHPKAQGMDFAKFVDMSNPGSWPYEGAKIQSMKGLMKKSGQYTNYDVDEIIYDPASQPSPVEEDIFGEEPSGASSGAPSETIPPETETIPQNSETIGKDCSVCTSYAMELAKAMIAFGFNGDQIKESLPLICDAVGTQGFHLYLHLKAYMEKERTVK